VASLTSTLSALHVYAATSAGAEQEESYEKLMVSELSGLLVYILRRGLLSN